MLMMTPPLSRITAVNKNIYGLPHIKAIQLLVLNHLNFQKKNIAFTCSPLYKFYSLRMQCCSWSFHVNINTVHL